MGRNPKSDLGQGGCGFEKIVYLSMAGEGGDRGGEGLTQEWASKEGKV
jgi:hypothetical protein